MAQFPFRAYLQRNRTADHKHSAVAVHPSVARVTQSGEKAGPDQTASPKYDFLAKNATPNPVGSFGVVC